MSDRNAGFVVALETNLREDDAAPIINAILQIRGVVSVEPVAGDVHMAIAESRERRRWLGKFESMFTEKREEND